MSARDELINLMGGLNGSDCCNTCRCGGYDKETLDCVDCAATANRAIDAYAHELAEKIRASTREGYGDPNPNTTYYEGDAAMGAADLIDPTPREAP